MKKQNKKIGFIGIGKIGSQIALRLLNRGKQLTIYDINKANLRDCIKKGAVAVKTPQEMATICEIFFLSLPTPEAVAEVTSGRTGLLSSNHTGMIIVDLSTNSPDIVLKIAKECNITGNEFLDAPLTGGSTGAKRGTFTIMIGGKAEYVEKIRPLLRLFTAKIVHVGPQGHGAMIKLIHNMLGEIQVYALAEAFCLAAKIGLNLDNVYRVLTNGMATSKILTELYSQGALRRNFKAVATVNMAHKDQHLLLDMAQKIGANLTFSNIIYKKIEELQKRGFGNSDVTSAIIPFEELYGVTVQVSNNLLNNSIKKPKTLAICD